MVKVIENIELLKKLQPYLGETEFAYYIGDGYKELENIGAEVKFKNEESYNASPNYIQTLTLEEAIELLPEDIDDKISEYGHISIGKLEGKYHVKYSYWIREDEEILINVESQTLLEAIEKMLQYLIDNNLLNND